MRTEGDTGYETLFSLHVGLSPLQGELVKGEAALNKHWLFIDTELVQRTLLTFHSYLLFELAEGTNEWGRGRPCQRPLQLP